MSPTDPHPANAGAPPRFRHAYDNLLPEMMALDPGELHQVNLDVPTVLPTVLGAWPRIHAMREQIVAHLPTFDIKRFDKIEDYTLALGHAQTEYMSAEASAEGLPALNERAVEQRDLFLAIARVLVLWKLLQPEQLSQFRGIVGYQNVAFELMGLSSLFRKEWGSVGPRTGLQLSELDDAERLGDTVLSALGLRKTASTGEVVQLRQRAFTLFLRAYNDAVRAITHLRWEEDDADTIIPRLYPGRPRKANKPSADPAEARTPAAPASPAAPAAPAVPGGPGGNPFIN